MAARGPSGGVLGDAQSAAAALADWRAARPNQLGGPGFSLVLVPAAMAGRRCASSLWLRGPSAGACDRGEATGL
eukprot:4726950-Pyramimonas_sp.AAC.1